jgi:hypothetical protein
MPTHDLPALKARLTIPDVWERLGLPGKPAHYCRSPFRADKKASFSIYEGGRRWKDLATGEGGDVIDFIARALDVSLPEATRRFLAMVDAHSPLAFHQPPAPHRHAVTRDEASKLREKLARACMHPGSPEEVEAVARLRHIDPAAILAAQELGTLVFGRVCGFPCWILTDPARKVAEARRIDGKLFPPVGTLPSRKAHTLAGSTKAWPVGVAVLARRPSTRAVLLVEGGPDYLAAHHWIRASGATDLLPVAMLGRSTGTRLHPEALALLANCRVRIYPHADPDGGGMASAEVWARQLQAFGCIVDYFTFSGLSRRDRQPVTDLNDAILIHPGAQKLLNDLLP